MKFKLPFGSIESDLFTNISRKLFLQTDGGCRLSRWIFMKMEGGGVPTDLGGQQHLRLSLTLLFTKEFNSILSPKRSSERGPHWMRYV